MIARVGEEPWRRGHEHRSFSSSLLHAIERSMDEPSATAGRGATPAPLAAAERRPTAAATGLRDFSPISTSGGFFSTSESESPAARLLRVRSIRTRPPTPAQHRHQEKERSGSSRSKLRDPTKQKSPASPGARLAGFLNSICTAAAGNRRKPKPSASGEGSACSTVSPRTGPCLRKAPSTRGPAGTSVRFHREGMTTVGEDLRTRGEEKSRCCKDRAAATREVKMRVEELSRGREADDDDDLFELDNLTVMGGRGGYRDELPVYASTHVHVRNNCPWLN